MIGAVEHLLAQISGLGIAPHRLFAGARQAIALAFGAQHQAGKRKVEGARQPHQHHRGRTDLGALDLADGRLRDPGSLGEIRQRPAAAVAFEAQA